MSLKKLAVITAAAVLLVCWTATPARAQVNLRFHDGLVTLTAQNAPLRAILAEWARQGGATIVNGERVTGPPLTLELSSVPERQALEILLRSVSGYMLAPRTASTPGASVFDRIMILPTSTAPRNVPGPQPGGGTPAAGNVFARPRLAIPQPPPPEEEAEPEEEPEPELVDDPDVEPEPDDDAPVVNPLIRPGRFPERPQPFDATVEDDPADDDQPQQPATPGNPFGLPNGTTSRPGVVTPVPRQPQQRAPINDPDP